MPLLSNSQTNAAFKILNGKSLSYTQSDISAEVYGTSFNITHDNIWLNQISSSPTTAISSGYALSVTSSLTVISTSLNHGYYATWPTTPPSGIDPQTNVAFVYNTGSLSGINAGDVIRNAISDSYGSSYQVKIYTNPSQTTPDKSLPTSDARNWFYQYNAGVFYQDNTTDSKIPATASLYVYIGPTLQSQPTSPYSNASASEFSLGGLAAGVSFSNTTFTNLFNSVLYPSSQANINTFTMIGANTSYEVGDGIQAGSYTFSWNISNSSLLSNNSAYIIGTAGASIYGPTSNTGTVSFSYGSIVRLTTPGTYTWNLTVLRSNGIRISKTFSIGWYNALYYGATTSSGLTNSFTSLSSPILTNTAIGTYTLPYGGLPTYKYLVIPDNYPTINSITWKGLPVVMADSTDGYTSSLNDINYKKVTYTNGNSITYDYKVYRTKNMIGTTMSNVIVS